MPKKIWVGVLIVLIVVAVLLMSKKALAPVNSNIKEESVSNEVKSPTENNFLEILKEFGKSIVFKAGDKFTFTDGLKVALIKINDSRCKEGVQCFWAGELSGSFDFSGGKLSRKEVIYLGTETNKSAARDGYIFELKSVTTKNAELVVTYKKP